MQLNHNHLTRQLDLINPDLQNKPIHIVGAGAIGSFLALELAKCGWTDLTVYDFDTVSVENMSNQFFRFSDIGQPKVNALQDLIKDFTQVEIKAVNKKIDRTDLIGQKGILFYCVDSMAVRKDLTEGLALTFFDLVIDTRMGAEIFVGYSFTPQQVDGYSESLFDDSQAVQERCTAKSTIYTACIAASMALKILKNFTVNEAHLKNIQWDIKSNAPFISFSHESKIV